MPLDSLGEGNTPLVRSRWIGPALGLEHVSFKLEQTNPTGSYKDCFAARLVSLLVDGGHDLCLGTSSGNAGAGAVSVAGLWQVAEAGRIRPSERVVCLLTGHGFKDEAAAQRLARLSERDAGGDPIVTPEEIDATLIDGLQAAPVAALHN